MDAVLQWAFRGAVAVAAAAMLAILIIKGGIPSYLQKFRLQDESLPPIDTRTWNSTPAFQIETGPCAVRYEGLSLLQAVGLALGGYDLGRNQVVFDRQMQYFFGPNATETISYSVEQLSPYVPMSIYNVSGVMVFGFRGFATGPELALQAEMIARYYATPMVLDITPLYSTINEQFLSWATSSAHFFGSHWFSPRSQFHELLEKAEEIYDSFNFDENSKVIFTGINNGGVMAKILARRKKHRGIAFLSFPSNDDEFNYRYEFDDDSLQYVTNVVNAEGWFGVDDPGVGENFVLPGDNDILGRDPVYPSVCNFAEMCGLHAQFSQYCEAAVDEDKLAKIREHYRRAN
jgi:hypothetical protein